MTSLRQERPQVIIPVTARLAGVWGRLLANLFRCDYFLLMALVLAAVMLVVGWRAI